MSYPQCLALLWWRPLFFLCLPFFRSGQYASGRSPFFFFFSSLNKNCRCCSCARKAGVLERRPLPVQIFPASMCGQPIFSFFFFGFPSVTLFVGLLRSKSRTAGVLVRAITKDISFFLNLPFISFVYIPFQIAALSRRRFVGGGPSNLSSVSPSFCGVLGRLRARK